MKNYFGCLLVLVSVCAVTGCGRSGENEQVEAPDAAMEQQLIDEEAQFEKEMMAEQEAAQGG